jgi:hypothetical protein
MKHRGWRKGSKIRGGTSSSRDGGGSRRLSVLRRRRASVIGRSRRPSVLKRRNSRISRGCLVGAEGSRKVNRGGLSRGSRSRVWIWIGCGRRRRVTCEDPKRTNS